MMHLGGWYIPTKVMAGNEGNISGELSRLKSFFIDQMKEKDQELMVLREELRCLKKSTTALEDKVNRVEKAQEEIKVAQLEQGLHASRYRHSGGGYSEDISDIEEFSAEDNIQSYYSEEPQNSYSAYLKAQQTAEEGVSSPHYEFSAAFDVDEPKTKPEPEKYPEAVPEYNEMMDTCAALDAPFLHSATSSDSSDFLAHNLRSMSPIVEAVEEDARVKRDWAQLTGQTREDEEGRETEGDTEAALQSFLQPPDAAAPQSFSEPGETSLPCEVAETGGMWSYFGERNDNENVGDKVGQQQQQLEAEAVPAVPAVGEHYCSGATCEDLSPGVWRDTSEGK